jgi:hypothetical protein
MNTVGQLAQSIIDTEFYGDTGSLPVGVLSGWLTANVGLLNILISSSFYFDSSGNFAPEIKNEEENIFKYIYLVNFYDKAARNTFRHYVFNQQNSLNSGRNTLQDDWTMFKEGDTVIQRASRSEIAKNFQALKNGAQETLDNLVFKYHMGDSGPHQVSGDEWAY